MDEEDRANPERRDERSGDQVVDFVHGHGPSVRFGQELRERRNRVQSQADRPSQLVRPVTAHPLCEYKGRKGDADHGRAERDRRALETHRARTPDGVG